MNIKKTSNNMAGKWQEVQLSEIGVFSKGAGITKEQLTESGHYAVRYGELYTRHNFQIKKIYSFIPDSVISETKKIQHGDILFAGSGETIEDIGKSAAYLLKDDCYAGGDIIIFSPRNANSLFLSYFLNVGEARKKLRELGQGQSVVHIYKSDIEKLRLHLPPLPEQNRIVEVLETWEEAIQKLAKKIVLKKNIKKGLMQRLLTGKIRLHGFNDPWKTVSLGDICKITTGKKDVNEGNKLGQYPFFTCAKEHTFSESFSFDNEAILIAGNGDVGHCSYFNGRFEAYQRTYVLVDFKYQATYLFLYLKHFFQEIIFMQKQMGAMPYIKLAMIKDFEINLPSNKEEILEISKLLSDLNLEVKKLEMKKQLFKEQKKYLLNNLITGAIRTPESMNVKA